MALHRAHTLTKILVPYYSQEDDDADSYANDCGPTCVKTMLSWASLALNVGIDRISRDIGIAPRGKDSFASMAQLMVVAAKYGLRLRHQHSVTLQEIVDELDAGRPLITRVHYGSFPKRQSAYNGAHFVVNTGYADSYLLVHDPDWWGERRYEGEYLHIPVDAFQTAFGPIGSKKMGSAYHSQALFVAKR